MEAETLHLRGSFNVSCSRPRPEPHPASIYGCGIVLPRSTGHAVVFFFQAEDGIRDFKCDWSSDVCSSDLVPLAARNAGVFVVRSAVAVVPPPVPSPAR